MSYELRKCRTCFSLRQNIVINMAKSITFEKSKVFSVRIVKLCNYLKYTKKRICYVGAVASMRNKHWCKYS